MNIAEIRERLEKAKTELYALCKGKDFTMSIPPQGNDTDLVIDASLEDIKSLLDEVERLQITNQQLNTLNKHLGDRNIEWATRYGELEEKLNESQIHLENAHVTIEQFQKYAELGRFICETIDKLSCKGKYEPDCVNCIYVDICRKRTEIEGEKHERI